jgi:methylglutaconyl-CoA hydratase
MPSLLPAVFGPREIVQSAISPGNTSPIAEIHEMSESSVLVTKDARGVATVTIDRPKVRNAIDDNVIRLLTDAFRTLGADGGTRMVVLTGSGAAFSAGADLGWMRRMGAASDAENLAGAKTISTMLRTLNQLPKPTIARINGVAYAAAAGLIAACDIAVAVEEAVFSISEVRLGLVPSTISPYVVAAIGVKAARRYFLTGEPFTAAEACRLGLVHQVVPQSGLDASIETVVSALLAGGPQSQARAKRLIAEIAGRPVDDALEAFTARSIADARASPEGREGITAFLEKRRPSWRPG